MQNELIELCDKEIIDSILNKITNKDFVYRIIFYETINVSKTITT